MYSYKYIFCIPALCSLRCLDPCIGPVACDGGAVVRGCRPASVNLIFSFSSALFSSLPSLSLKALSDPFMRFMSLMNLNNVGMIDVLIKVLFPKEDSEMEVKRIIACISGNC